MRSHAPPGLASPGPDPHASDPAVTAGRSLAAAGLAVRSIHDPWWRAFVASQAAATAFHHPAWSQLLAETYHYRPFVLTQLDGAGAISAGLPVLEIRSRITGHAYVSLPFTDHCPPLARDGHCFEALAASLVRWQREQRGIRLDVHAALPAAEGVYPLVAGVRHFLSLEGGEAAVARRLKGTPVQRGSQKAAREGVQIEISRSSESLDQFYRLHWLSRRKQGVPVQPRRFIQNLWANLLERDLGFAVLASAGGRAIAGAVFLSWNGTMIYKYGASDPAYWKLRPNNLVMWTAIQLACRDGYGRLDFGKSDVDNVGLRNFKSRWGAEELPLAYSRIAATQGPVSSRLPTAAVSWLIKASPPIVCRGLGEVLYRHLAASGEVTVGKPDARSSPA